MNRFLAFIFYVLILLNSGLSQEVRSGNLTSLIAQIKAAMPDQNSYEFVIPTASRMDSFRTVTRHILNQEYHSADSLARLFGYGLYEWTDTAYNNSLYYILMEPNAGTPGGVKLGWGTFIFNPDGSNGVAIEVPHPLFDSNTWQVGFTSWQVVESRYFLMAGTHRYANGTDPRPADVAHNMQNMFHVVHQEISPLADHTLQVHGFSRSNHPGYPDVVLSNGTPFPGSVLDSLAQEIMNQGYTVGIFDGVHYASLGATTNTQGQFSNSNGYSFIHMEIEYFIRANPAHWEKFVDILYDLFHVPVSISFKEPFEIPVGTLLYPGYPNPFNSRIRIEWYQPVAGTVTLQILNVLGQPVCLLSRQKLSAGAHSLSWDGLSDNGKPAASGLYLVVLRNGNYVNTTKIVLSR